VAPARELLCGEEDRGRGRQMTLTTKERSKLTRFVEGTKEWIAEQKAWQEAKDRAEMKQKIAEQEGQAIQWFFIYWLAWFYDTIARRLLVNYAPGFGWEQMLVMGVCTVKMVSCYRKIGKIGEEGLSEERMTPYQDETE